MAKLPSASGKKAGFKPRSTRDLSVSITDWGVYIPRYGRGPDGQLYMKGRTKYKSLPEAIRAQTHTIESLAELSKKHTAEYEEAARLHGQLLNWKALKPVEKSKVMRGLNKLSDSVEGKRAVGPDDSVYRQEAVEQLDETLAEINTGKITAKMTKVKRILGARKLATERELERIPQRRTVLVDEKKRRDAEAFGLLDRAIRMREDVAKASEDPIEQRRLANAIMNFRDELSKRGEGSLKNTAREQVARAVTEFRGGDSGKASESLRQANRTIAGFISKYALLPQTRIDQIARSDDAAFKKKVARAQLKIIEDHAEYWKSPHAHESLTTQEVDRRRAALQGMLGA